MTQEQPIIINITVNTHGDDSEIETRLRQYIAASATQIKRDTIAALQRLHQNSPGRY